MQESSDAEEEEVGDSEGRDDEIREIGESQGEKRGQLVVPRDLGRVDGAAVHGSGRLALRGQVGGGGEPVFLGLGVERVEEEPIGWKAKRAG